MKKNKKKDYTCICEKCGTKHYSKTTNFKGRIVCPSCDKWHLDTLKMYERNPLSF